MDAERLLRPVRPPDLDELPTRLRRKAAIESTTVDAQDHDADPATRRMSTAQLVEGLDAATEAEAQLAAMADGRARALAYAGPSGETIRERIAAARAEAQGLEEQLAAARARADQVDRASAQALADAYLAGGDMPTTSAPEADEARATVTRLERERSRTAATIDTLEGRLAEAEAAEAVQQQEELARRWTELHGEATDLAATLQRVAVEMRGLWDRDEQLARQRATAAGASTYGARSFYGRLRSRAGAAFGESLPERLVRTVDAMALDEPAGERTEPAGERTEPAGVSPDEPGDA